MKYNGTGFDDFFNSHVLHQISEMKRWNGLEAIKTQTLAEHIFTVSMLSSILADSILTSVDNSTVQKKLDIARYATFRDFGKVYTGDVSHVLKSNKAHGQNLKDMLSGIVKTHSCKEFPADGRSVDRFMNDMINRHPGPDSIAIVDLSIHLSNYLFIWRELRLGNNVNEKIVRFNRSEINSSIESLKTQLPLFNEMYNIDILSEI